MNTSHRNEARHQRVGQPHLVFALGLASIVVACSDDRDPLTSSPAAPDASVMVGDADSTAADVGFDGGIDDLGPDVGRVDRTLVELLPLGTLPVENLVLSPTFDTFSAVGPRSLRGQLLSRFTLRRAPTDTAAVRIASNNGLFQPTQTHGNRLQIEIWVGRPEGQPASNVSVALFAVSEAGLEVELDVPAVGEQTQILDGVEWQRFAATSDQRLFGVGALVVENNSGIPLLVTGPSVVEFRAGLIEDDGASPPGPVVRVQPVSEHFKPVARFIQEWTYRQMRENLQAPQRKPLRPSGPRLR